MARLAREENEGGEQSSGKRTSRGNRRALMARPEPVGAEMPTRTVARPPFWLAALVVTTDMARLEFLLRPAHVYRVVLLEWSVTMVKDQAETNGDE